MSTTAEPASCLPPVTAIALGFTKRLRSLPDYSLQYDFNTVRALLVQFISQNYPDWKDFLESSSGMMLLELIAYTACMLAFRSDFQRAQGYLDSVTDTETLTRMMLLVGEKLITPSPTFLYQVDPLTKYINMRMTRTDNVLTSDVYITPGQRVDVATELGTASFELFELTDDYIPKYVDAIGGSKFLAINNNAVNSDPPANQLYNPPARPWILVEGVSHVETFVSNGSADQLFSLAYFPILTDYANGGFRASVQLISRDGSVVDNAWTEVATLSSSGPYDKNYEMEWDGNFRASIKFGNGVFGAIPPQNYFIRVYYRTSPNSAKKISSSSINLPISAYTTQSTPTTVMLTNFAASIGGGNGDNLATIKALLPARIRRQGRLVSGEDFASYASEFPGIAKAQAELLNNDATGNLVRLRIMEYTLTAEGYARPFYGVNQTILNQGLPFYTVTKTTYYANRQATVVEFEEDITTIVNSLSGGYTGLLSVNGISRVCSRLPSDLASVHNQHYSVYIADDDATSLFPIGATVGLSLLNGFTNVPAGMAVKLTTSTGQPFNVEGPGVYNPLWPGMDSQIALLQIDDEFIEAQVEPDYPSAGSSSFTYYTSQSNTGGQQPFCGLNIVSRGKYGTQVTSHMKDSRVYLGGVRPDLYRAINTYKVEPCELLLLEGKVIPIYILLTVRSDSSASASVANLVINALESYFNFTNQTWGFGMPLRISPILSTVQAIPGIASVEFSHATQYVVNNTDSTQANYVPLVIDKDITGVPNDSVLGLLPFSNAIGTISTQVNTNSMPFLLGEDVLPQPVDSISLATNAGSDFSLLPPSGVIKIAGEFIAYQNRDCQTLWGITRNLFSTSTTYAAYGKSQNLTVSLAPNIIIKVIPSSD
jgi:hypothetical protein